MKDNIIELWPEPDHNLPPRPYRVRVAQDTHEETQTALDLGWYDNEEPRGNLAYGLATLGIFYGSLIGGIFGFCNFVLPWIAGAVTKLMGA